MFTGAGWGGGDPAVRGRVGVNGASERSEKGAEQRGGTRTKGLRELGDIHIFTAAPPIWTLPEISWLKSRDSHKDLDCRSPGAAGFSNEVSSFTFSFLISQVQSWWSYFSCQKYSPQKIYCCLGELVTWPLCGWNLAIPQTSCSRWKFLFKVKWRDCMRSWGLDHISSWSSLSTLSVGLPRHQQHSSFCAPSIFVMLNFDWLMSGIMFLHYNNHSLPVNGHQ